ETQQRPIPHWITQGNFDGTSPEFSIKAPFNHTIGPKTHTCLFPSTMLRSGDVDCRNELNGTLPFFQNSLHRGRVKLQPQLTVSKPPLSYRSSMLFLSTFALSNTSPNSSTSS
ncbi:hypothetical protein Ancab_037839, partial [Ancistrocladus abbreviatus]